MDTERPTLDDRQRRELLGLARRTIVESVDPGRQTPPASLGVEIGGAALEPWGAFVSICVGEELRGCVGIIEPAAPLHETVRDCAQAAATRDHRFEPLAPEEIDRARLEISVLTAPVPLDEPSRVEIGRHGLIVSRGSRKGLLLPQVAIHEGWGHEEFLDQACRKAGLPPGDWRHGADVEAFEALVFGD